jgi:hypothetical protein
MVGPGPLPPGHDISTVWPQQRHHQQQALRLGWRLDTCVLVRVLIGPRGG